MNEERTISLADSCRTVVLSRHPLNHIRTSEDSFVICPGDIAARQLGFPPLSLDEVARQILERNAITVAPEHIVLRVVAEVLAEINSTVDCNGMARTIYPAINNLFRSGADLDEIAELANRRVRLIPVAALKTRRLLESDSRVAKSDAIRAVVTSGSYIPRSLLVVYGYARLIEMEYKLIDLLAGPGSAIYLPYSEKRGLFGDNRAAADYLKHQRGWIVPEAVDHASTPGQLAGDAFLGLSTELHDVAAYSYPTMEDEVRGVLATIKQAIQAGRYGTDDVALVARSETLYGDWVREIAWEYDLPIQTHYSVTLLETRVGQWLNALLDVAEAPELPFEATARLFRHVLGNRLCRVEAAEDNWHDARKEHTRGADKWNLRGLVVERLTWPDETSRAEWVKVIRELLTDLQIADLCKYRAQDVEAFDRLHEALLEFALPRNGRLTRADFAAQLRDLLRITTVQFDTGTVGIDVHTPLSLYGATVKHVFVLGAADSQIPRPIADDAMLDFYDRAELARQNLVHLETAAQAARREMLSFYSLLLSASESLTFSFPRLYPGAAAIESSYLTDMGLDVKRCTSVGTIAASRGEFLRYQIYADNGECNRYVDRARGAVNVVRAREANRSLDIFTGRIGISLSADKRRFSPSQITTFGQCAYKWFAERLLHLGEPEEAEDDLAPDLKGRLYHEVLHRTLEACKLDDDLRGAMLARLDSYFDMIALGMPELARLAGWSGRRIELLNQLRKAIVAAEFLLTGSQVLVTEEMFEGDWLGLRVRGTLDRLDLVEGELMVIDYKTSGSKPSGAKDASGQLKLDVQLPIYMAVGAREASNGKPAAIGYYYSLTKGAVLSQYNLPGKKPSEPNHEALHLLVDRLRAAIDTGEYPVAPDVKGAACRYCELDLLCRKGSHLFRDEEEADA